MFSRRAILAIVSICIVTAMAACKDDPAQPEDTTDEVKVWPVSWQGVWQFHGTGRYCDEDSVSQLTDFYDVLCKGKPVSELLVGDENIPCTITVSDKKMTAHCVYNFTDPESSCKVTETIVATLDRNDDAISGTIRYTATSTNCTIEEPCYQIAVTAERTGDGVDECAAPAVAGSASWKWYPRNGQ